VAFLGPAVSFRRYQVSDDVVAALASSHGAPLTAQQARPDGPGHWRVDLVALNRHQLVRGGVPAGNVTACRATTDEAAFFSDRSARPCGRQALLARLTG
jgi:copper oxidase (laccase) domain-containing protein